MKKVSKEDYHKDGVAGAAITETSAAAPARHASKGVAKVCKQLGCGKLYNSDGIFCAEHKKKPVAKTGGVKKKFGGEFF